MKGSLLLFGASGRTGQVIAGRAAAEGYRVISPTHADCPLENTAAVSDLVLSCGAGIVINAAAVSNLEACEDNPLHAHLVNAVAPAAMALACRHTGARFLHLSTDYVLDGRRAGLKDESAHCKPLNIYGESKREAELSIAEAYAESIIARVSWVGGFADRSSFIEQTVIRARRGEPLSAIADQFSLPTHAGDIARVLLHPALENYRGILHICSGGEPMSRHACASAALREAAACGLLPAVPAVQPQRLKDAAFYRAARPQHTAMSNARLLSLGIPMPTGEEAIRAMVRRARRDVQITE